MARRRIVIVVVLVCNNKRREVQKRSFVGVSFAPRFVITAAFRRGDVANVALIKYSLTAAKRVKGGATSSHTKLERATTQAVGA